MERTPALALRLDDNTEILRKILKAANAANSALAIIAVLIFIIVLRQCSH